MYALCNRHLCITVWLSGNYLNSILERQRPAILLSECLAISVRITWESVRGKVEEVLVNCKPTCYKKSVYYFACKTRVLQVLLQSQQFSLHFPGNGISSTLLGSTGMWPKREREQELNRRQNVSHCIFPLCLRCYILIFLSTFARQHNGL